MSLFLWHARFFSSQLWFTEFPHLSVAEFEVFPSMKKPRICGSHILCASCKRSQLQRENFPPSRQAKFSRLYIPFNNLCGCPRHQNQGLAVLYNNASPVWNGLLHDECSNVTFSRGPFPIHCILQPSHTHLAGTNLSIFHPSITLFLYFTSSDNNRLPSIWEAPVGQVSWPLPTWPWICETSARICRLDLSLFSLAKSDASCNIQVKRPLLCPIPPVSIQLAQPSFPISDTHTFFDIILYCHYLFIHLSSSLDCEFIKTG